MIKRIMMIFIGLRGSICRSEAAESRRIHLLLKQIARIGVVDVRAVLQSLHQVLGVIPLTSTTLVSLASQLLLINQ